MLSKFTGKPAACIQKTLVLSFLLVTSTLTASSYATATAGIAVSSIPLANRKYEIPGS